MPLFWTESPESLAVLFPQHNEMAKKQIRIDRVTIVWRDDPSRPGTVSCRAVAEVSYFLGGTGDRRIETFTSGGLYGIDENSDPDYLGEIASEQLDELELHLGVFGVKATPAEWRELRRAAIDANHRPGRPS